MKPSKELKPVLKRSKSETTSIISLEGMEFFAYHGCIKEEQIIGTKFILNLYIETITEAAEQSDDLNKTINYQDVYKAVETEINKRSNLLEHVGRRIIDTLLEFFPDILNIELKISKMNPPIGGKVNKVSLTMHGSNEQQ